MFVANSESTVLERASHQSQNEQITKQTKARSAVMGGPVLLRIFISLLVFANITTFTSSSFGMPEPTAVVAADFWGVITSDNVPLRCSPSEVFYIVGEVQSGAVVYVTKIDYDSGWAKINAPAGTPAFAFARDFELQPDRKWAVAPALCYGRYPDRDDPKLSWKRYVIEAGTTVKVLEEITTTEDEYLRIEMPEYVPVSVVASFIRPATDEEIAAHRKRLAERKAEKLTAPGKEATAVAENGPGTPPGRVEAEGATINDPTATAAPAAAIIPEASADKPADVDKTSSLGASTETTTADTPSSIVEQPEETRAATELAADQVGAGIKETAEPKGTLPADSVPDPDASARVDDSVIAPDPVPSPALAKDLTLEELEVLYEDLKTVPILEAEITPILAGFSVFANDESQSAGDRRRARARMKLLEIRRAHQDSRRRIAVALAEADDSILNSLIESENLARKAGQATALVGKLTLSNVYDGNRLPLRYRLRDRITGRTLAYVPLVEKINLASFLDENVRITGARVIDPALNVTVINLQSIALLDDEGKNATVEGAVNSTEN